MYDFPINNHALIDHSVQFLNDDYLHVEVIFEIRKITYRAKPFEDS
jgi:hypothetical protein